MPTAIPTLMFFFSNSFRTKFAQQSNSVNSRSGQIPSGLNSRSDQILLIRVAIKFLQDQIRVAIKLIRNFYLQQYL
jgi:hypothetical protein